MKKIKEIAAGWNRVQADVKDSLNADVSVWMKIKRVVGIIVMVIYRLRSVFLAIPVAWFALKLAAYNREHLPEQVGVNLQQGCFRGEMQT